MGEFFKRNMVWFAISLCVIGVILSIAGIPTKQPILFIIGVICSIPTIAYIIYQVFFDTANPELEFQTLNGKKITATNLTTVIDRRENILLMSNDTETNEFDFEPLYNGFATEPEIDFQLDQIIQAERDKVIQATPATVIPDDVEPTETFNEEQVKETTQGELLRQREIQSTEPTSPELSTTTQELATVAVDPEPATIIEEPDAKSKTTITNETETIQDVAVAPEQTTEPTPTPEAPTVIANLPENTLDYSSKQVVDTALIEQRKAERQQKAQEKKFLLSQANLEKYLKHYFIETATCFLLDRNIYKDSRGIAPYNKLTVDKETELPTYEMSSTKGRLYKFCTYLPDAERFIMHPNLYTDFVTAVEKGIPLVRISETLHLLYRKKYKKDFIVNLANREDWDNVIILVFNNYILNNDNFKDVFRRVPFNIPVAYNEQNVIDYLSDSDVQSRFMEKFPSYNEIGIPTFWDALYICFINSIKEKLSIEQIETAILKEHKKIVRALKRADKQRQRMQKAS